MFYRLSKFSTEDFSANTNKVSDKCSEIMSHFIEKVDENQYIDFAEMTRRLSLIQVQWNSTSPSDSKALSLNKPQSMDTLSSAYPSFKTSKSFTEPSSRSRANSSFSFNDVEDSPLSSTRSIFESTESVRNRTPPLSPHTDIARRMSFLRKQAAQKTSCLSPKPGDTVISPRTEGLPPLVQRSNRRRSTTLTDEDLSVEMSRSTSAPGPESSSSSVALERSLFEGFDWLDGDNNTNDNRCRVLDASNVSTMSAAKRTQQRLRAERKSLASTI